MKVSQWKAKYLRRMGFIVGPREPRLNRKYPGGFMVVEHYDESELPTDDGSNGPWCIVGDDLAALVEQAFKIWEGERGPCDFK